MTLPIHQQPRRRQASNRCGASAWFFCLVFLFSPTATHAQLSRNESLPPSSEERTALLDTCTPPPGIPSSFTSVEAASAPRAISSLVRLTDGRILVAGGQDPDTGQALAVAEVFDPASETFTLIDPMVTARIQPTRTLLTDGTVLIAGGRKRTALSTVELFDPGQERFERIGRLKAARYGHVAVRLVDGQVLLAGGTGRKGRILRKAERFDPQQKTFSRTGSMIEARSEAVGVLLPDGQVLIVGGVGRKGILATAELYDPSTGRFSLTGTMMAARKGHTATLLPNGEVLIVGGIDDQGNFVHVAEHYDPVTGQSSPVGILQVPRFKHTATLLINGQVLIAGGQDGSFAKLAQAELYDPAEEGFRLTGAMHMPRSGHAAAELPDHRVFLVGGAGPRETPDFAEFYTPDLCPRQANLVVSQSDSADPISPNKPLTYIVIVQNAGPDPADSVVLQDTLPLGSILQSVIPEAGTCLETTGQVRCQLGHLAADAAVTVTLEVMPTAEAGFLTNIATVTSTAQDPDHLDNTATEVTSIVSGDPFPMTEGASHALLSPLTASQLVAANLGTEQKISDTAGGLNAALTAAGLTLTDGDRLGRGLANIGDLDGDGNDDLAVGAPADDDGSSNRGAVYIVFMNADRTVKSVQKISSLHGDESDPANVGIAGLGTDDQFGIGVDYLGDLGPGAPTPRALAVGAFGDDDGATNRGAVYILFLNTNGSVHALQKISDTQGGFTGVISVEDRFGIDVEGLGDLNGDGIQDIAVGNYLDDDGDSDSGAIWILFLNSDGTVKSSPAPRKISQNDPGLGNVLAASDFFGLSIANIGDLDKDGVIDLAVGAHGDNDGPGSDAGAVWILFMNSDGTLKGKQKISDATGTPASFALDASDNFSFDVEGMGDLDGDGIVDLAVGAQGDDDGGGNFTGAVYLLFLNLDGTVRDFQKISSTPQGNFVGLDADDRFAGQLANLGDLDGDGIPELAVGANLDDDTTGTPSASANRGAVWQVFLGPTLGVADLAVVKKAGSPVLSPIDNGTAVTFQLTITNFGPDTATVNLRNEFLSGSIPATISSPSCSVGTMTQNGNVVTCANVATLSSGQSQDVDVTVTADSIGLLTKTSRVSAGLPDPIAANGVAVEDVQVNAAGFGNTWTGATSTDWTVATNWSSGTVPAGESVFIPASAVNQPTLSAAGSVGGIEVEAGATLTLDSSANLTSSGLTTINGTLALGAGTTFTQNGGSSFTNSTTGIIQGNGNLTVVGTNVSNAGQINPGDPLGTQTGTLTVAGSIDQQTSGTFNLEIGSAIAFDQVSVSGALNLNGNGTLNVTLINSFEPSVDDDFPVITFGSASGDFATTSLPDLLSSSIRFTRMAKVSNAGDFTIETQSTIQKGWSLTRTDILTNVQSVAYNPRNGRLYVTRDAEPGSSLNDVLFIPDTGPIVNIADLGNEPPAGLVIDPDDGDIFVSRDFIGDIRRIPFTETLSSDSNWVSNLPNGNEDDPTGLAIAPNNYIGSVLPPGWGLVTDRGFSGGVNQTNDDVWRWNPDAAESIAIIHNDDGSSPSNIGELTDASGAAAGRAKVYVIDTGDENGGSVNGILFRLDPGGPVVSVPITTPGERLEDPVAIKVDPVSQDVLILDAGFGSNQADPPSVDRLVQINPNTGELTELVSGFSMNSNDWNSIDVHPDGHQIFVADNPEIYTFTRTPLVVNNIGDAGDLNPGDGICEISLGGVCTLRAAIEEANALPGTDFIQFGFGGSALIQPASALPAITDSVSIDGYTEVGASPNTLTTGNNAVIQIEINGASTTGASGLVLDATSVIRGLAITGFDVHGIHIRTEDTHLIEGNFVGLHASGLASATSGNGDAGIQVETANNLIGGPASAARNVISANGLMGVRITGAAAIGNHVKNNYIGTNPAGTSIDPDAIAASGDETGNGDNGVYLVAGASDNVIGGTTPAERNILSGNGDGVHLISADTTGNVVQGNFIGTDVTGTLPLGNTVRGIQIEGAPNNLIGGTTGVTLGGDCTGACNVISGSGQTGVSIITAGATGNRVMGNFIGTNVSGTGALPNALNGVFINNGASGNFIGVKNTILPTDPDNVPEARNLISGNTGNGISIAQNSNGNSVKGNFIGVQTDGVTPLGNSGIGILIGGTGGSDNNVVGGTDSHDPNLIANNGGAGVVITDANSTGNTVRENSIVSNTGLGIDIDNNGVNPNDPNDIDGGTNLFQNFPDLTSSSFLSGTTTIQGNLDSKPSTTFDLDFFANTACDGSGNGEGELFLGTAQVTTDINGDASINVNFSTSDTSGQFITATATDPSGNTSEFSQCFTATSPVVWTNPAGGNWSVGTNWSTGVVPGATDDVFIGVDGTYTVTLDVSATVNSLTLGGATGTQTLSIASNTLTLNGDSTVTSNGILNQSGGTITGTGDLTINSLFTWTGGTQSGTTGTETTTLNGGMTVNASFVDLANRRLVNPSGQTVTWTSGLMRLNNATFENQAGGIVDFAFNTTGTALSTFGGSPLFTSAGEVRRTGTGTATIGVPFTHTGPVTVTAGTLAFTGNSTHDGPINAAGFGVEFGGNVTHAVNNMLAADTVTFSSVNGTTNIAGTYTVTGTTSVAGMIVNWTGAVTGGSVGTTFILSSGTANFSSTEALITLPGFTQSGGLLTGSDPIQINGLFTWTGGTQSGTTGTETTTLNGGMTVNASFVDLANRRLVNPSGQTVTWTSGLMRLNNATFENQAGGIVDFAFNTTGTALSTFGGSPLFTSAGEVRRTGTGTATIAVPFENNTGGLVNPQVGDLAFTNGFIQFDGTTQCSGGNISVTGAVGFDLRGGTLSGNDPTPGSVFCVDGNVTQTGGQVIVGTSPGITTINGNYDQQGGTLEIELEDTGLAGGPFVAGTDFDQLNVTGTATLNGTLNVTVLNPPFGAVLNDTLPIMTYGTLAAPPGDDFNTKNFPALTSNLAFEGIPDATTYSLTVGTDVVTPVTPPANLVGWWSGDHHADDIGDANGNGLRDDNNGTLQNGATFGVGQVGQAFSFDGVDDFLQVPDNVAWAFGSNDFTINLWANFDTVNSTNILVGNDEGAGTVNKWVWSLGGSGAVGLHFHINGPVPGSINIADVAFTPVIGQWHHLAVTRSGNTFTMYVDGSPVSSEVNAVIIPDANAPLTIGQAENAGFVDGRIDEVQIISAALTAPEIAAIFNAGAVGKSKPITTVENVPVIVPLVGRDAENDPLTFNTVAPNPTKGTLDAIITLPLAGLVSHWAAEGDATDSADGNNGTLQNGAAFAPGQVGQAFTFDGVDDVLEGPIVSGTTNLDPTGSFTVGAWVKTTSLSTQTILNKNECGRECTGGVSNSLYRLHLVNGIPVAEVGDSDRVGGFLSFFGNKSVADGQWHYVAMARDISANAFRIFVDGQLDASTSLDTNSDGPLADDDGFADGLIIGALINNSQTTYSQFFNGQIDEVQFYDRALTPEGIQAIFAAGTTGQCVVGSNIQCATVQYTPTAGQTGADSFGYEATDGTATSATTTVNLFITPAEADLALTIADDNDPITLGTGDITYTLTITNNGPDAAENVTLTDTLPSSVAFVSATLQGGTGTECAKDGSTVECAIGSLVNGASAVVDVVVTPGVVGLVSNTATVSSPTLDPVSGNNTSTEETGVFFVGLDKMWTGAESTDWGTAGNWTPAGVPAATQDVLIPASPSNQPVLSSSVSVNDLTVEPGATVDVGFNTLTAQGNVDAGNTVTGFGFLVITGANKTFQGTVGTNLRIEGDILLNGPTTVEAEVLSIEPGGRLTINGQTLNAVVDDLIVTISNAVGDGLIMTNASDDVTIGGNATFTVGTLPPQGEATSVGNFTAGTLRIRGNFAQEQPIGTSARSFVSTGTTVVFDGAFGGQMVTFASSSATESRFQNVQVATGTEVTFDSDVLATGAVTNSGTLTLGSSTAQTFTVEGAYTQTSTGTLNLEIGGLVAGAQFDQIVVAGSGPASLSGTVNISLINGFVPSAGNNFAILTYGSLAGDFLTKNGLFPGGNLVWTTNPGATAYTLQTQGGALVVNSSNDVDDGTCDATHCSLREAITAANANAGATDFIIFNIGGGGLATISPASALPTITDPVVIDGYTQPGAQPNSVAAPDVSNAVLQIEIDGTGLAISSGNSTIRGLVLNNFGLFGLDLDTLGNNVIEGNYLGTNVAGDAYDGVSPRGVEIRFGSNGNRIGGVTPAARNVIATPIGIEIGGSSNTVIQGNFIGTDVTGASRLSDGSSITVNTGDNTKIGGIQAGARNIITGSLSHEGIQLSASDGVVIQGNFIGTDVTGTVALSRFRSGIAVSNSNNVQIGGTTAGARNLISGNVSNGIFVEGVSARTIIQGNFIGTDVSGTLDLGNGGHGIGMSGTTPDTVIGGNQPGAGNVISGNSLSGISFEGTPSGSLVQGNMIGTQADGVSPLGNDQAGIVISAVGASNFTIGGAGSGVGNIIAFNGDDGISHRGGTGVSMLGNLIFSNTQVGIDLDVAGILGDEGVTPNDVGDSDNGPNNKQNFPDLTLALLGSTAIQGALNSTPNTQFIVEFFSTAVCDASGHGEGETFVGRTAVTTDGAGNAPIDVVFDTAVPLGHFVTSTATEFPGNNTSEFSQCLAVTNNGVPAHALTVTTNGNGTGSVASVGVAGIDCGADCEETYPANSVVTLRATPAVGSVFQEWSGPGCAGVTGPECTTNLSRARQITATFCPSTGACIVPEPVPDLQCTSILANSVTCSWHAPSVPTGASLVEYRLLIGTTPGVFTREEVVPADKTLHTIFSLPPVQHAISIAAVYSLSSAPISLGLGTAPAAANASTLQVSGLLLDTFVTPAQGLEGWVIVDEGTVDAPSSWSGVENPRMKQFSTIHTPTPSNDPAQLGTIMFFAAGLPHQRTDYRLQMQLQSGSVAGNPDGDPPIEADGAVGVLFRLVDMHNYYRFSWDRGGGYRRLVKRVNGVFTVLCEQNLVTGATIGNCGFAQEDPEAYEVGTKFTVVLITNGPNLQVKVTHPFGFDILDWMVTDPDLQGIGFGYYTARNAGAFFTLQDPGAEPQPPPPGAIKVDTIGPGVGVVASDPLGVAVPGSPSATFPPGSMVSLLASSNLRAWMGDPDCPDALVSSPTDNSVKTCIAEFPDFPAPSVTWDVNADTLATPEVDGQVILRYLFGLRGPALIQGLSMGTGTRNDPQAISGYLDAARSTMLDVDGNGQITAMTDGMLIVRFLQGVRGDQLIAGVVDPKGTRTTATAIEAHLVHFLPDSAASPLTAIPMSVGSTSLASMTDESNATGSDASSSTTTSPLEAASAEFGLQALAAEPEMSVSDGASSSEPLSPKASASTGGTVSPATSEALLLPSPLQAQGSSREEANPSRAPPGLTTTGSSALQQSAGAPSTERVKDLPHPLAPLTQIGVPPLRNASAADGAVSSDSFSSATFPTQDSFNAPPEPMSPDAIASSSDRAEQQPRSQAETTSLPSSWTILPIIHDSTVSKAHPHRNLGRHRLLQVGGKRTHHVVLEADVSAMADHPPITEARLELTLYPQPMRFGKSDLPSTMLVYRLVTTFTEGKGRGGKTRKAWGHGPGVTWACATDAHIGNRKRDCTNRWDGGRDGTAPSRGEQAMVKGETVVFDVTADVRAAVAEGASTIRWVIVPAEPRSPRWAMFYSREGARDQRAPGKAPHLVVR